MKHNPNKFEFNKSMDWGSRKREAKCLDYKVEFVKEPKTMKGKLTSMTVSS